MSTKTKIIKIIKEQQGEYTKDCYCSGSMLHPCNICFNSMGLEGLLESIEKIREEPPISINYKLNMDIPVSALEYMIIDVKKRAHTKISVGTLLDYLHAYKWLEYSNLQKEKAKNAIDDIAEKEWVLIVDMEYLQEKLLKYWSEIE